MCSSNISFFVLNSVSCSNFVLRVFYLFFYVVWSCGGHKIQRQFDLFSKKCPKKAGKHDKSNKTKTICGIFSPFRGEPTVGNCNKNDVCLIHPKSSDSKNFFHSAQKNGTKMKKLMIFFRKRDFCGFQIL